MLGVSQQAAQLDDYFRMLASERQQFKLDAEIGGQMNDMQARQMVQIR